MSKKSWLLSVMLLTQTGAWLYSPLVAAEAQPLDRVVAVVDEDVIMASELGLRMNMMASQIRQAGQELPPEEVLQKQILERLVLESLELQIAERAAVKVSDAQLDQAVASVAKQNRMEPEQFASELASQGIPYSAFRENIRREIIIQQVQQAMVNKRIDVSEQDINNFLASEEGRYLAQRAAAQEPISQTHARHILVKTSAVRNDDEAAALLNKLRAQLLKGADFTAAAKQYSEDPGSMLKGGDLDWTSPGQMVPEFEAAMKATEINQISAPFRSQFGWHILQVLDRRQQDMSEAILRQQAQNILRKRQYQDELPRWLKELRDRAYVQIKV